MSASRLDPAEHAWLAAPSARRVIEALEGVRSACVKFVGGCVRDALMGRPIGDVDLATTLPPADVSKALKAAGIKVVPTGVEHGTVTAVADGVPYEVTTLRRDVATDGRRAVVAFTESWEEDSRRRDFRLNAIYCSPDGEIFDPEQGAEDAAAGLIRFIGDPAARLYEDYLRILRFFRFYASHGRGRPDADGLKACAAHKAGLAQLSAERVWMELKKLLSAPAEGAGRALRWMNAAGLLKTVLPENDVLERADRLLDLEAQEGWPIDPMRRLMALIPRDSDKTMAASLRLKLSKAERGRLNAWARDAAFFAPAMDRGAARQAIYRAAKAGVETGADRAVLEAAEEEDDAARVAGRLETARLALDWSPPVFPLKGRDLAQLGIGEGPAMGEALAELEEAWITSGFKLTQKALLAQAQKTR